MKLINNQKALLSLLLICCYFNAEEFNAMAQNKTKTVEQNLKKVNIIVEVPEDTPTLFMPGNLPELGPWDPAKKLLTGEGTTRQATLNIPQNTTLEFKFTLGSWEQEALTDDGNVPDNYIVQVKEDITLNYKITQFRDNVPASTTTAAANLPTDQGDVKGTLIYHENFASQILENARHIAVWFPPQYDQNTEASLPVVYMHDGQNLFDPRVSTFGIDWGVDETATKLIEENKIPPVIIVGIFNNAKRRAEYDPFQQAAEYSKFIVEELKPFIDENYRTKKEAASTATIGSSMGGLISIYLCLNHPEVFGLCGAISAHLMPIEESWGGTGKNFLESIESSGGIANKFKLYIDQSENGYDQFYGPYREKLESMLTQKGWEKDKDYQNLFFENSYHTEQSWRERLHVPFEFLLKNL